MEQNDHDETVFGYKRITPQNLKAPDVSRLFGKLTEQTWIELFDEPKLLPCVPQSVQGMFEHARGAMIYGWFYYPLLSTGYTECARTIEAGARNAARILWPENKPGRYERLIASLHDGGWIEPADRQRWDVGRQIRNSFAHPEGPALLTPNYASGKLRGTSEQLNRLFAAVTARKPEPGQSAGAEQSE